MLAAKDLVVSYGAVEALHGISFEVKQGEIVTLVGANGAGKSTTLRAVSGLVAPRSGTVSFDGADVTGMAAHRLVRRGLCHVPEGRHIFTAMTVRENLELGAYTVHSRAKIAASLERALALFPRLGERIDQPGGTLSGGEQQMLAIARALMSRPRLLLLDEPSLGLAPLIVKQIFATIREINEKDGVTVLLVEQNAFHALRLAHRGYVLVNGNIAMAGSGAELLADRDVRAAYLEGGHKH